MMHHIYNEMIDRNTRLLGGGVDCFVADELLDTVRDRRRCIALVAEGDWEFAEGFKEVLDYLVEGVSSDCYCVPQFHHTFLVARPFEWIVAGSDYTIRDDDIIALEKAIRETVREEYTICFDKIVAVQSGVVFVGGDDILDDINRTRESFRAKDLIYGERYKMDILHFTALRWKKRGEWCQKVIERVERTRDVIERDTRGSYYYAKLRVKRIKILEASWLLLPHECRVLATVELDDQKFLRRSRDSSGSARGY